MIAVEMLGPWVRATAQDLEAAHVRQFPARLEWHHQAWLAWRRRGLFSYLLSGFVDNLQMKLPNRESLVQCGLASRNIIRRRKIRGSYSGDHPPLQSSPPSALDS